MQPIKSLTIGISAHNEEANMRRLLDSILCQKAKTFRLDAIIVACDGCSDNTSAIVRSYQKLNKKIHLIDDGKRLGKAMRLNHFYHENRSDIILILDADVVLSNTNVLQHIVTQFKSTDVGLVGGCNKPLKPGGFFEKIIYTWLSIWFDIRVSINKGNSIHNHLGCVSALSKALARQIVIPNNIIPDDDFVFIRCLQLGYTFRFAKHAIVYYRSVTSFADFLLQHSRLLYSKKHVVSYFGDWVWDVYKTSGSKKVEAVIRSFIKTPFFTLAALVLQVVLRSGLFRHTESYHEGFWRPALSSKNIL